MAEAHAQQEMIERALTRTVESEGKSPLAKVVQKHNAGIHWVGIELPPLNATLGEVYRELAKVRLGAKDMAIKNKNVRKMVKISRNN